MSEGGVEVIGEEENSWGMDETIGNNMRIKIKALWNSHSGQIHI